MKYNPKSLTPSWIAFPPRPWDLSSLTQPQGSQTHPGNKGNSLPQGEQGGESHLIAKEIACQLDEQEAGPGCGQDVLCLEYTVEISVFL